MNKKGISLIVLVITIIVMITLVASVVITLTNTEIINKANIAVNAQNEKEVQHLAEVLWAEAYAEGEGKWNVNQLEEYILDKLSDEIKEAYVIEVTNKGATATPNDGTIVTGKYLVPVDLSRADIEVKGLDSEKIEIASIVDPTIVKAEILEGKVRVKGLKQGTTQIALKETDAEKTVNIEILVSDRLRNCILFNTEEMHRIIKANGEFVTFEDIGIKNEENLPDMMITTPTLRYFDGEECNGVIYVKKEGESYGVKWINESDLNIIETNYTGFWFSDRGSLIEEYKDYNGYKGMTYIDETYTTFEFMGVHGAIEGVDKENVEKTINDAIQNREW